MTPFSLSQEQGGHRPNSEADQRPKAIRLSTKLLQSYQPHPAWVWIAVFGACALVWGGAIAALVRWAVQP